MLPGPYEHVPLTGDDKSLLLTIYDSRRRFLFCVYVILIAIAFACSNRGTSYAGFAATAPYFEKGPNGNMIATERFHTLVIDLIVVQGLLVASGLFFLFRNVLPFRKDVQCGVKEKIPFTVVRKEYFPFADKYYVWFDDQKYETHEVDAEAFNKVNEGDNLYLYRAIYSKYIFEMNGRFTLL